MTQDNAKERFSYAGQLFKEGEYLRAIDCLNELLQSFPGEPRIVFAKAQCLQRLGHVDEVREICERLKDQHGHAGAIQILQELDAVAPMPDASGLEDGNLLATIGILDEVNPQKSSPLDRNPSINIFSPVFLCLISVFVLLLLVILFSSFSQSSSNVAATPENQEVQDTDLTDLEAESFATVLIAHGRKVTEFRELSSEEQQAMAPVLAKAAIAYDAHNLTDDELWYLTHTWALENSGVKLTDAEIERTLEISTKAWPTMMAYGKVFAVVIVIGSVYLNIFATKGLLLLVMRKLPHDGIWENVKDIAVFSLVTTTLTLSVLGIPVAGLLLMARYELSCLELVIGGFVSSFLLFALLAALNLIL